MQSNDQFAHIAINLINFEGKNYLYNFSTLYNKISEIPPVSYPSSYHDRFVAYFSSCFPFGNFNLFRWWHSLEQWWWQGWWMKTRQWISTCSRAVAHCWLKLMTDSVMSNMFEALFQSWLHIIDDYDDNHNDHDIDVTQKKNVEILLKCNSREINCFF